MRSLDPFRRRATARPAYRLSARERRQRREKLVRALVIALLGVAAFLLGLAWDRPSASASRFAPAPSRAVASGACT